MSSRSLITALSTGCCLAMATANASAAVIVNVNDGTNYTNKPTTLLGQELTPAVTELGTTKFAFSNVSNTSWTATPTFTGMLVQQFRGTNFTGADWSNVAFTMAASTTQQFQQANFTNANFSGAVFDKGPVTGTIEFFNQAIFANSDFSGATISMPANGNSPLRLAVFSSASNFDGATILAINSNKTSNPLTFAGSSFEGATLGFNLENINLDNVSFKNATFIAGATLRTNSANFTNFEGAHLTLGYADHLTSLTWLPGQAPTYDANTIFTTQTGVFDPVASGWTLVVPEPTSLMLVCAGFLGLAARRRQS